MAVIVCFRDQLLWVLSLNNLKKLFFELVVISAYVIFCKPFLCVSFTECHILFIKNRVTGGAECDCYTAHWKIGYTHFLN